ncbi:MAG: HAD family hydrolase [Planctomycetes bacterium]|nr:HAD family hydrolase [Planctomycetota bacterium]
MSDKAIFLDRDDTLIADPGYINHPDQVKLLDGVAESLAEFSQMGYKLIVVSNQSGVARAILTEETLSEIHSRLKQLLLEKNVKLDKIYYCPYHPDGVIDKYRKESDLRKPNPGMLLEAADEMDVKLSESWMIGNSSRDIQAGSRAGCKTILINQRLNQRQTKPEKIKPDYKAVNMKEAVNIIKMQNRSGTNTNIQNKPFIIKPHQQPQPLQKPKEKAQLNPSPKEPVTQNVSEHKIEKVLHNILEQLKSMQRDNIFGEFSTMRLIAGIVQILALASLFAGIWFLMSPDKDNNNILISLAFALVLQVMAMTFYTMQNKK